MVLGKMTVVFEMHCKILLFVHFLVQGVIGGAVVRRSAMHETSYYRVAIGKEGGVIRDGHGCVGQGDIRAICRKHKKI